VLEDFSVHSFQNLGLSNYLIAFMATMLILSLIFFLRRMKLIPNQPVDFKTLNRENGLVGSLYVFAASAFLIFIGTSSPIITGLMGNPSQVDISFYDKVNLPVGALLSLLLAVTPFLLWVEKDLKSMPRKLFIPLILAVISTIITVLFGDLAIAEIIFLFTAYLALWANLFVLYRNWKVSWRNIAGPLSHFGVGIVFVSIIIAGNYTKSERLVLEKGSPSQVMDHKLTFQGLVQMPDNKNILEIRVENSSEYYVAKPRIYATKNRETMREPDVRSGWISDVYIAPLELRAAKHNHDTELSIVKGETKILEGYNITFERFDMSPHGDSGDFHVGAVVNFGKGDHAHTITPLMIMSAEGRRSQPAVIPPHDKYGKEIIITLTAMNADEKRINLAFQGLTDEIISNAGGEQLVVEISTKPFMSILWLGTVLMIIGSIIAFSQRIKTAS
jgi:cytochrome c-type biogenesis protein CcmF